jgi:hypothetical protein
MSGPQIGIPILAPADAAIARFESANADLHVVVGAGKAWQVIALDQPRSQVTHHFQEMAQTQLFLWRASLGLQKAGQFLEPLVEPTSDLSSVDLLGAAGPGAIKDMLQPQDPLAHASHLRKRFSLLLMQAHDGLEPLKPLLTRRGRGSPLFSSRSKLLWICCKPSSIASPA